MERTGVVLILLIVTVCSSTYGYSLTGTQFFSEVTDKESVTTDVPTSEDFTTLDSTESPKKIFKLKVKFNCFYDGLWPNPEDCTKYINCSNGISYELSCPSGKHFNKETKRCEMPCSAKCDPQLICSWKKFKNGFQEMLIKGAVESLCSKDGTFRSPFDCEIYFKCQDGNINAYGCQNGQHFNTESLQCEEPCKAHCDLSLADKCGWKEMTGTEIDNVGGRLRQNDISLDIPDNAFPVENSIFSYSCHDDGLFPYPNDCTLGVRCMSGMHTVFSCTDVLHFNNATKKCENFCSAHCDPLLACICRWDSCQTIPETTTTENYYINDLEEEKPRISFACREDGLFASREHCNQYFECLNGRLVFHRCPPGLHFNKRAKTCESPCKAKCDPKISCGQKSNLSPTAKAEFFDDFTTSNSVESSQEGFELKEKITCLHDGLWPIANDCNKYVNCSNGIRNELTCPSDKHFNRKTRRCETPCSAKCDMNLMCNWPRLKDGFLGNVKKEYFEELCSKDGTYMERNPLDCETYFRCQDGDAYLFQCPDNQHFNRETLQCEEPCDAHCNSTLAEKCGWEDNTQYENAPSLKQPIFDFQCPENGMYASLACESFIQCTGGQAYLINCPQGEHYDIYSGRCTTPCKAGCAPNFEEFCKEEEKNVSLKYIFEDFDCKTDGYHVNPIDCTSFIQCFEGHAYVIFCPEELHYSPTLEICMSPCDAKCAPNYEDFCRAEDWRRRRKLQFPDNYSVKQPFPLVSEFICSFDGIYPNPEECNSYIQCTSGESHITLCPEGLHFSGKTLRCEPPCEAHCDDSIGDTCGWNEIWAPIDGEGKNALDYEMFLATDSPSLMYHFTCIKDGIYKNPENCSTFIQCSHRHSYLMTCPEGLHFNENIKGCDYPCNAHCDNNIACDCGWDTCEHNYENEVDCEAEPDEGPCKGRFARYAYDVLSGRCRRFLYGGCRGNSNNFKTVEECENKCRKKILRGYRCPEDNGMFAHFPDCISYYHCKRGIATLKKCPKGTAFDHKRSKCVTEYEATCVYECRDNDAVYPYEEDCRKYIDCVNGIAKLEKCPPGKAFDPQAKDCIDEREVDTCFWES